MTLSAVHGRNIPVFAVQRQIVPAIVLERKAGMN